MQKKTQVIRKTWHLMGLLLLHVQGKQVPNQKQQTYT